MAKILVIEDDIVAVTLLTDCLELERHAVECAPTGEQGWDLLANYAFDLAIVDWELPDIAGPEIIVRARAKGLNIPILMLTGKSKTGEKAVGLDAGADDYLTKPFASVELLARVRALLRRAPAVKSDVLKCRKVTLDTASARVSCNGQEVKLLPAEHALLEYMLRHQGEVLSAEVLLNNVWSTDSEATVIAVRTNITRLRKKLGDEGDLIKTVHGLGYVMESKS